MALTAILALTVTSPPVGLTGGMVLSKSCTVAAREYFLTSTEKSSKAGGGTIPTFRPALTIKGNHLTVDFAGATLRGTPASAEPDQRKGLGVLVEGNNITIKNLRVHGYKIGLVAANCQGLRILDSNFSYNWKQHLKSTPEKENEADWQSYHHNEHNEWLRYGAGIYLEDCSGFQIRASKAVGGQCGLMIVRSNNGVVWGNNFSYLSGVGLGMYRSSRNRILYNRLDWCVRGFSYGVYNRGQDSAGILVFEQCNNNVFGFNSVTHGGDGFFLWAGQTTMDTAKGGCNGNLVYANDFSSSPCNGIEATFSSNTFSNNKLIECWHGVWGGYSFDSRIVANLFGFNGEAVAIEHGQNNSVVRNIFYRENTAIDLWQDPITDRTWPYPKHHDTASKDYQIAYNVFDRTTGPAISVRNTTHVLAAANKFVNCASAVKEEGDHSGSQFELGAIESGDPGPQTMTTAGQPIPGTSEALTEYFHRFDLPWAPFVDPAALKRLDRLPLPSEQRVLSGGVFLTPEPNHPDPFLKPGVLRGQRYILIGEWGPYDFESPLLWPRQILASVSAGVVRRRFEVLGPSGRWQIVTKTGVVAVSKASGSVPGFVDVDLPTTGPYRMQLEYTGAQTTDYRGLTTLPGQPVAFSYHRW